MKFARESYSAALVSELLPLLVEHHAETADEMYGPLDPDLAVYKSEAMRIYTARQSGDLVGYQIFVVSLHPHSRKSIQASQDILYLKPKERKGLNGYRFMKWCCDQLKMEGVEMVHQHIPARNSFGKILERMGFRLEDLVYSKRLEVA